MKSYYLLRNNRETGPFTWKELKGMVLLPTDLIWVEGESTCWSHPTELEELQDFVNYSTGTPAAGGSNQKAEKLPLFSDFAPPGSVPAPERKTENHNNKPSFEELKKKYAELAPSRRVWNKSTSLSTNVFGVAVLAIGALMIVVMVRKAMDHFEYRPIATEEAHEITAEKLTEGGTSHAALAVNLPGQAEHTSVLLSSNSTTDTATAEAAPQPQIPVHEAEKAAPKPAAPPVKPIKPDTSLVKTAKKDDSLQAQSTLAVKNTGDEEDTAAVKKATAEADKDESKTTKPAAPKLQVTANNYDVGFLGGISNLELTVKNPSSSDVDHASIQVEYLKPNGKVVGTETVSVSGLDAGSSKTVAVPGSKRGVRVRFHVIHP